MKVCVLGGGVVGISAALCLKKRWPEDAVTIVTDKTTPFTTGDGSAGLFKPFFLGGDLRAKLVNL